MKHVLLILLLLNTFISAAQQADSVFAAGTEERRQIDSLSALIRRGGPDTTMASAYVALTEIIGYVYPDTVVPLSKKTLAITDKYKKFSSSSEKKIILHASAGALNNIGLHYTNQGNISLALEYYHRCLKIMEENNDKSGIVVCLNNIGSIYRGQKDNIQALDYHLRALKLARAIDDKDGTASSLGYIGVVYNNQGNYERAIEFYKKSMKIREQINDPYGLAMSLSNLGLAYERQDKDSAALFYYEKALSQWYSIGDQEGVSYTFVNIGNLYLKNNNIKMAESKAIQAYDIAREIGFPEDTRDAAELLYKIYKKKGQWQKALEMQEIYIAMRDSINNEESQKAATKKLLQYQYEKDKLALKKDQEKKDLVRLEEKQRQRLITIMVCAVLVIVLVFSAFLFNRFRLIRKQKKIIEEQKHIVEEKQKEVIDSIKYARRIQNTLLADKQLIKKHLSDFFIFYQPKDLVSGDFYWAAEKNNSNDFYIAVCDSTGHGVPGAFMSLLNVSFLNEAINEQNISEPGDMFSYVRSRLISSVSQEGGKDGMDGVVLRFSASSTSRISYAAAYNSPLIIRKGNIIEFGSDKMPVGQGERTEAFVSRSLDVETGDMLYLFTDGFADQFGGPKGKKLKYREFYRILSEIAALDTKQQEQELNRRFASWKGSLDQVDDVLVVGIRI
jgi:serine phosphatase RsbU (regulator of sigma subunit)